MPIKFKVNIQHFAKAARANSSALDPGDIVFAWDDDSSCIAVGEHRGFKDTFDSDTGELVAHKHRVFVRSWTDSCEMLFNHCVRYPMQFRPMVVTPKGTGVIDHFDNDIIVVQYANGDTDTFNESEVKLFEWNKICDAEEKND